MIEMMIQIRCQKCRVKLLFDGRFTWCGECGYELERTPTYQEITGHPYYKDTPSIGLQPPLLTQ